MAGQIRQGKRSYEKHEKNAFCRAGAGSCEMCIRDSPNLTLDREDFSESDALPKDDPVPGVPARG